ncbi:MAG: GNAT family N-acetyltransferase [Burkholderia sp.]
MSFRSVRRANAEDVPVLTRIRNDAHAMKVAHGDHAWGKDGDGFSEAWVLNSLSRRDVHLVEQDGLAVATFSLDWDDEAYWGAQAPIAGYVHGLSVRNGFNGLGIGRFAIDWCAARIRARERQYVRLGCDARNTRLCAYYESQGFVRVGIAPQSGPGGYVDSLYEKRVD